MVIYNHILLNCVPYLLCYIPMFIIFYLTFSCSLLVLHRTSLVERERGHVHGMRSHLEAFSEKSFPQQTSRFFQSSLLWIHNFFVKCRSLFLLWA